MRLTQTKTVAISRTAFDDILIKLSGLDGKVSIVYGHASSYPGPDKIEKATVSGASGIVARFTPREIAIALADECECLPMHVQELRGNEARVEVSCVRTLSHVDDADRPWKQETQPRELRRLVRHAVEHPEALTWPGRDKDVVFGEPEDDK